MEEKEEKKVDNKEKVVMENCKEDTELNMVKTELEETTDRYKRLMAEFDNYKKNTELRNKELDKIQLEKQEIFAKGELLNSILSSIKSFSFSIFGAGPPIPILCINSYFSAFRTSFNVDGKRSRTCCGNSGRNSTADFLYVL